MLGLALEGGGSRGAYHVGVYRACQEEGLVFDAICGTSIGAVNSAMLVQGDYPRMVQLWQQLSNKDLFEIDNARYKKLLRGKLEAADLPYYKEVIARVREEGGVDTGRMQELLRALIDVDRLLESPVDFGLVTVSLSDLKPLELFKNEIPREKLVDYIMASATLPGFQPTVIDEKNYIDGGIYDNCPMGMLVRRGCDRIIGVRTFAPGIFRMPKAQPDLQITMIEPSESLGHMLNFEPKIAAHNMEMGYYDALRVLRGYSGKLYCCKRGPEDGAFALFCSLEAQQVAEACHHLGLGGENGGLRVLLEQVLPAIGAELGVPPTGDYTELLIAMAEDRATRAHVPRFAVYPWRQLLELGVETQAEPPPKTLGILPTNHTRAALAADFLLECLAKLPL